MSDIILTAAGSCKLNTCKKFHAKTTVSASWYDKECQQCRTEYNTFRNKFNKTRIEEDKTMRDEARSKYRSICKKKCYLSEVNETKQLYVTKRTDPRAYWKHVIVRKPKERELVTLESYREHFSNMSISTGPPDVIDNKTYTVFDPILDRAITVEEVEKSIKHLKKGKSPGEDYILSEFIDYGKEHFKQILADLLNKLYVNGYFPEKWSTGVIVPIYKKGDKSDPSNYRGITLTSSMSKLMTYLLNERLLQWLDYHKLSSQHQFAYKPGYSTIDAVYVLQSVIAQNKPVTFCAFIDFSKAFDKVVRSILYNKLKKCGISSMMLQIIEDMYSKIQSKVRTSDGHTDPFPLNIGLLQGECLSPSLFSILIDDIVEYMNNVNGMGIWCRERKITVLKYADDLVLLANTTEGLQSGLDALHSYCITNKLTVNTNKSKIMCFANKVPNHLPHLRYNEEAIEWVNEFKYLGVTFSRQNTFTSGLGLLCHQAQRAQTVVDLHVLKHKTLSVEYILDLFDTLVKPILTYGCEVYGMQNYNVVEKFYLKFLKRTLNVKMSTNTSMIYAETGRYPLTIDIKVSMIKQWIKIIHSSEDRLIWQVYNSMKESPTTVNKRNNWAMQIKDMLCTSGFRYIWEQQAVSNKERFLSCFKTRCQDMYMQQCFSDMSSGSRCRLYRHIKEDFQLEPYLRKNYNRDLRQCLTKIRLSSHKLYIERGRWQKPKVEYCDRLCTLCEQRDIEDEYHVLMTCPHYKSLRLKFIKKKYYEKPSMRKFTNLLTTTNDCELHRLMTFIKLVLKDYNLRLHRH